MAFVALGLEVGVDTVIIWPAMGAHVISVMVGAAESGVGASVRGYKTQESSTVAV
jgi:hypothetical protein